MLGTLSRSLTALTLSGLFLAKVHLNLIHQKLGYGGPIPVIRSALISVP